jgi:hypothetical protein
MSTHLLSKQRGKSLLQHELAAETFPSATLPGRWNSRVFYVFSALLHVAAAVALSSSLAFGTTASKAQADTATATPQKPTVARMAIDVGPIKFCEMKIESLVGGPRPQPTP